MIHPGAFDSIAVDASADDRAGGMDELPWPHEFDQSKARWRWLLDNHHPARLVIVEHLGQAVAGALFERQGEAWFLWKGPSGAASAESLGALLRSVGDMAEVTLVLQPGWVFAGPLGEAGFLRNGDFGTLLVSTGGGPDEILRRMKDATRRRVQRAIGAGLRVAEGADWLPLFYPVYSAAMTAAGSPDFATYAEHQSLLRIAGVHLFVALDGDAVAAGSLCYRNSDSLEARYVATDAAYRHLGPLNLVHFESIQWAAARGLGWFDLSGFATGEVSEKLGGINRFKAGFGGVEFDYPVFRRC